MQSVLVAVPLRFTLCLQGPYYGVLKGSRALTLMSLEGQGLGFEDFEI